MESLQVVDEGFDAYHAGVSRYACPYSPWFKEYYDWLAGWDQAQAIVFEEGKNPTDDE